MSTIPLIHVPDPFWPERGAATYFCVGLGTFDLSLIGFLVSRVML